MLKCKHKQFKKKIHNQIHPEPGFLDFAASLMFGKLGLVDVFFVLTFGGDNFSGFVAGLIGLVTWHWALISQGRAAIHRSFQLHPQFSLSRLNEA